MSYGDDVKVSIVGAGMQTNPEWQDMFEALADEV